MLQKNVLEENPLPSVVEKTSSELYFDYVKYINDHSFTNDMLRYMLREFVAITSLVTYDDAFKDIMNRFLISCHDVESHLNSL